MFIVVKIKCVNSDRNCDKVNFTIKLHTFYNTLIDILSKQTQHFIRTHTNITNWHVWQDDSAAGSKNFPKYDILKILTNF